MARVRSLAQELLNAVGVAKKIYLKNKRGKDFDISDVCILHIVLCILCYGRRLVGNIRGKGKFSLLVALLDKLYGVLGENGQCLQLLAWTGPAVAKYTKLRFRMECGIPHVGHYFLFMGDKH